MLSESDDDFVASYDDSETSRAKRLRTRSLLCVQRKDITIHGATSPESSEPNIDHSDKLVETGMIPKNKPNTVRNEGLEAPHANGQDIDKGEAPPDLDQPEVIKIRTSSNESNSGQKDSNETLQIDRNTIINCRQFRLDLEKAFVRIEKLSDHQPISLFGGRLYQRIVEDLDYDTDLGEDLRRRYVECQQERATIQEIRDRIAANVRAANLDKIMVLSALNAVSLLGDVIGEALADIRAGHAVAYLQKCRKGDAVWCRLQGANPTAEAKVG